MLWPMLLDYSRNECKRYLRKLELEAYASIVSAFRAQGELSKDKKKMLHDLCSVLSISMERHKAEIRRAVNDEKLNTIADRMVGPNTGTDWAIEGRRLVPLMPRLVPQTAFTALANNFANIQAAKNATMPLPSTTGQQIEDSGEESKTSGGMSSPLPSSLPTTPVKGVLQPLTSPDSFAKAIAPGTLQGTVGSVNTSISNNSNTSNVLLQSGVTIQLKGNEPGNLLVTEEERESNGRKRKRSTSLDSTSQQPAKILVTAAMAPSSSSGGSTSPVIITSTTSGNVRSIHGLPTRGQQIHKTTIQGAQGGSKVFLVSGTSGSFPPSILQRCLSVPVAGKTVSTPVSSVTHKSTATSTYSVAATSAATGVNTVSSLLSSPLVTSSPTGTGNMLVYTTSRPRSRTGSATIRPSFRPRAVVGTTVTSLGQPGGPGTVQFPTPPSTAALKMQSGVQKPTTTYLRTPGVKILSQMVSASPTRPRTPQSPSFGLNASKSSQANQNVGGTPRIVNVMSVSPSTRGGGTSLISTRLPTPSKLGQAIASRISSTTGGAKPNVIVVHKAQVWPQQQQQLAQGTTFIVTKSGQSFKDIVTYSQKQQQTLMKSTGGISVVKPSLSQTRTVQTAANTVTISTTTSMPSTSSPSSSILELDPSQLDEQKNTLLADLIQAAGIAPDAAAAAAAAVVSVALETFPPQMQTTTVTTTIASSASPVSLVSSVSTTPCITDVTESMESDDAQDSAPAGGTRLSSLQLTDLISEAPDSFSTQIDTGSESMSNIVVSSVSNQSSEKTIETVTTVPPKTSVTSTTKTIAEPELEKEDKSELTESTTVAVEEIEMPLEHGQVLEIQAPDAAALLNSEGQLSKEVLEILHKAGFQLQNDQVTIDTSGLELTGTTMELHLEDAPEEPVDKKKEEVLGESAQVDPSTGLIYLPGTSEDQEKEESKDETMPSIVSVFSSGVIPDSQLNLETLHLVEDVLTQKSVTVEQEAATSSAGESAPQSFLEITDLQSNLAVIDEASSSNSTSVVVESADKSYIVPNMSIDNVIEVGSTELVITGEEVQVDSAMIKDDVLVASDEFGKRNTMDFM